MKNIVFCILFLATSLCVYSQDQSKLGMIVFESSRYTANMHLAPSEQEIKEERGKLKKFVEENIDSKKTDAFINPIPKAEILAYGDSLKCIYTLEIYKDVYDSKVSCEYFKKSDIENYKQINRETLELNTVKRYVNTNKYTIFSKRKIDQFSISDTYRITEHRDDVKIILGYKCFKIVLEKKSPKNAHLDVYNIEMFVTEDIKLNYSPIIKYKDILNKYYPLQVAKKPKKERMIEVVVWKAIQIDLKNL
ncbi:hypothetical protein [uncultured Kordia sp.]|uniref:hypothetical protein n=1 Tax=uncultured Kordia sp. TaxID=507699 RepID=UPI002630B89F|nr:hypothetical protein [uncultured Kordia sp.]